MEVVVKQVGTVRHVLVYMLAIQSHITESILVLIVQRYI